MQEIISLVEAAFAAKRTHGPTSSQFKEAQNAAFKKINDFYQTGAQDAIRVDQSTVLPAPVHIKIQKTGSDPNSCSFVLEKPQ